MRKSLLAAVGVLVLSAPAYAVQIETFGQTSLNNTVTATDNGTTTNISITNDPVAITSFLVPGITSAIVNFTASSIDAAVTFGSAIIQHYAGNFCFTSASGCGGTNYLSGTFSDAAFGAGGGPGLVINTNNPPDSLVLTSDVIPSNELDAPSSFNLTFTNLDPVLHINGTTIAGFTASYAGNVSSNATATPEPASLALLGVGLVGAGMVMRRKQV